MDNELLNPEADPWTIDADNIDFSNIKVEDIEKFVVLNERIAEYLRVGHNDKKLIVVGPKGLGKTLLLKAKSHMYRKSEQHSYRCIPSGTTLIEKLVSINYSFSANELNRFKEKKIWEQLWEMSLCTLILRTLDEGALPQEIKDIQGDADTLLNIVRNFLNRRQNIVQLYESHISRSLSPRIGKLGPIAVFIDNIDEGLGAHAGENLRPFHGRGVVSEEVWVNAQLALMTVIRNICSTNKHIKIFASVRSEAANCMDDAIAEQLRKDWCLDLKYLKSEIREIFERAISHTPKNDLKMRSNNLIESFVGSRLLNHKFVMDGPNPRPEDVFDFIYRHTFGRPRDIVAMGLAIKKVPAKERTEGRVREVINAESGELLEGYKKEIVPYFPKEAFDRFCALTTKNVIPRQKMEQLSRQIKDEVGFDAFLEKLHSLGLLGATVPEIPSGRLVQKFLEVGEYSFMHPPEPKVAEYFLLHSSIDATLKNLHGDAFYDRNNIIGNGYGFERPTVDKSRHLHIGLTRDSLSLIIPEAVRTKSLIIYQEPLRGYKELSKATELRLVSNVYDDEMCFTVINPRTPSTEIDEALADWKKGVRNIVLYRQDPRLLSSIFDECQTMTIEGMTELPPGIFDGLRRETVAKVVYLCQRFIHDRSFKHVKEHIKAAEAEPMLKLRTSLIDRFTFGKDIVAEGEGAIKYVIRSEEFGRIIVRKREGSGNESSDVIRRTRDLDEQLYYESRQKVLVEGTYRLAKLIKKTLQGLNRRDSDQVYRIFFDIQIGKLLRKYRKGLRRYYPNESAGDVYERLKKFCLDVRKRLDGLETFPAFPSGVPAYIEEAKKFGIFPTDGEFYEFVRESAFFVQNDAVIRLQELMDIKPLTKLYRSVFLSFTERDRPFAKKISDCLKKRGVETYFYHDSPEVGEKKDIEKKQIDRCKRVIFIASENSLTSDECQQELSFAIEKKKKLVEAENGESLKDIIIPIKLDNFVLKPFSELRPFFERTLANPSAALENIHILRATAIQDFTKFKKRSVDREFERQIEKTIMPALREEIYRRRRS